ncbi:MAG: 23S rRNA (guanosine(2251)-2'-O)-methyltransferase RlmB, partial [Proteobacteria bacterium]|nr:23S rRNA (guanosine(2251)-2'-O)-methyltransferase RlmB [Pseudomonadota bacterium]
MKKSRFGKSGAAARSHGKFRPEAEASRRPHGKPKPAAKPQRNKKPAAPATPRQGVLLWGVHAVREAWLNPKRRCFNLWLTENSQSEFQAILRQTDQARLTRPTPKIIDKSELDAMLPRQAVHQGVVLEAAPLPDLTIEDILYTDPLPRLLLVLDQVTDPHNIGAILRSAAALGAGGVIVTERHAPNVTGVLAKSASGALEHVPLVSVVNLARALKDLRAANYWVVGLAEEGQHDLASIKLSGKTALVLGAEGDGLRRLTRENCDELARLPTGGAIG